MRILRGRQCGRAFLRAEQAHARVAGVLAVDHRHGPVSPPKVGGLARARLLWESANRGFARWSAGAHPTLA
jgi:hypothetical protein